MYPVPYRNQGQNTLQGIENPFRGRYNKIQSHDQERLCHKQKLTNDTLSSAAGLQV